VGGAGARSGWGLGGVGRIRTWQAQATVFLVGNDGVYGISAA